MSNEPRVCPSCQYLNGPTTPFCHQCGRMLVFLEISSGVFMGLPDPEPEKSPAVPRSDTRAILKHVAAGSGYEYSKTASGYRVVVPLKNGRSQKVYVLFNGRDDEGRDVISFLSFCGPAKSRHAMDLLRFNSKLTYCAFAVQTVKDVELVVVTANQLSETADQDEIRKKLFEVARWADATEKKLMKGRDTF